MQATVYHEGKLRFRARARGHQIRADQPFAAGGQDSGMTPLEWLLSALGSCMGMSAVRYLEKQNLDSEGLQLSLRIDGDDATAFAVEVISVHVVLEAALDQAQQLALKQAVEGCELFQIMQTPPQVRTEILSALPKI